MAESNIRAALSSTKVLALGAVAGAILAAVSILQKPPTKTLPDYAVASVNGTYILRADYDRALAGVTEALTKEEGPSEATQSLKQRTIDRLIEEELLVQRALDLGLPEKDPQMRAQLSARVLEMVANAQEGDDVPDDKTLRAFHEKEPGRFRLSGRFRVDVIFFAVPQDASPKQDADTLERAKEIHKRLGQGERFEDLQTLGSPLLVAPPNTPLPVTKLQDYLGATATRAVITLEEGRVSEPIRGSDGYRILRLAERIEGEAPNFEAVRKDVENAYRKQQEDARLRKFLDLRKQAATIVMAPIP